MLDGNVEDCWEQMGFVLRSGLGIVLWSEMLWQSSVRSTGCAEQKKEQQGAQLC